jgi:sulfate/thiosulfate transport system permease protein
MAGSVALRLDRPTAPQAAVTESTLVRRSLIAVAILFLTFFLFLPLALVFTFAFRHGVAAYVAALTEPDAMAAIRLTLVAAGVAVPLNTAFGVAAAWAIAKFEFKGKNVLITLIDVPFAISPVIAGLIFVLLFGARGWRT